jgi:RNA polymerase-binding transcription factor DksA
MDPDGAREQLEREKTRLEELRAGYQSEHLTDESEDDSIAELSHQPVHMADTGTETFNRERDMSILEQIEAELTDVEHALQRLDDGTYGICEACGAEIGDDRLEAMPEARFCVNDQALAEREARAPAPE